MGCLYTKSISVLFRLRLLVTLTLPPWSPWWAVTWNKPQSRILTPTLGIFIECRRFYINALFIMCFNIYMNKCLYINLYGCTCILFLSGASSEIVNPAGWEWVRSPISFEFFQFLIYTCGKSTPPRKQIGSSMVIRVQFFGSFFLFQYLITGYLTAWTFIPDDWEVIRKITKVMLVNTCMELINKFPVKHMV